MTDNETKRGIPRPTIASLIILGTFPLIGLAALGLGIALGGGLGSGYIMLVPWIAAPVIGLAAGVMSLWGLGLIYQSPKIYRGEWLALTGLFLSLMLGLGWLTW
ncbi:hypothetical protein ACFL2T_02940 [Elusimicrobiota bacterium]